MQVPFGFISRWYHNLGHVDHCSHTRSLLLSQSAGFTKVLRDYQGRVGPILQSLMENGWILFIWAPIIAEFRWMFFFLFLNVKEKEVCHELELYF